ncbi:MAG: type II toxin-antitoxin system HicB family antitoxin [Candidatus Methanoperedenaceae archaeon]|nr:MAG: type II toxin-antitoxin system HicB family antitoxin [Candidatus Methanoperedenaceae archaeon]
MQFTVKLEESEKGDTPPNVLNFLLREGDTKEEAIENIKEAIQLVLEVSQEQARAYTEVFKVEAASA